MAKELEPIEQMDSYIAAVKYLDQFEAETAGLSKKESAKEPECLHCSIESLRNKDPEQLNDMVFELNQYSIYIQRLMNRREALKRWAKSKLDDMEAFYIEKIDKSYGFNERPKIARHNPEICQRLNEFIRQMELSTNILYDVPNQVKMMADAIKDMKFLAFRREKAQHD